MAVRIDPPESGQGGFIDQAHDNPERAQRAKQYVDSRNNQRIQPMTRAQMASMEFGTECWIYNVSPIFEWRRMIKGLGIFVISKAPSLHDIIIKNGKAVEATAEDIKGDFKLSTPVHISKSYKSTADKGECRRIPYVEYGDDIAEAIVGNSKIYPVGLNDPTANLENWGVFITYGKPYEQLSKAEQNKLYTEAMAHHQKRCYEKVQRADSLVDKASHWVLDIHRQCALYVGEDRRWVTDRNPKKAIDTVECPFCESEIKATAVVCKHCQNIVDQAKYDKMKKTS